MALALCLGKGVSDAHLEPDPLGGRAPALSPWVLGALAAAVLGTPHCVGMCGGLASAGSRSAQGALAWHAGRLGTYAGLGALAGAFGHLVPGPAWLPNLVAAVLLVVFAGGLAGLWPPIHGTIPGLSRFAGRLLARGDLPATFLFGATTGLLPCGLLYSALAVPVAAADPLTGALAMLVFGAGTLPGLAAATFAVRRLIDLSPWSRRMLAAGVLAAGLWAIGTRQVDEQGEPTCHEVP